jgi:hypothetical protein
MKSTTGADDTALSMALRVASERSRRWAARESRKDPEGEAGAVVVVERRRRVVAGWRSCLMAAGG